MTRAWGVTLLSGPNPRVPLIDNILWDKGAIHGYTKYRDLRHCLHH